MYEFALVGNICTAPSVGGLELDTFSFVDSWPGVPWLTAGIPWLTAGIPWLTAGIPWLTATGVRENSWSAPFPTGCMATSWPLFNCMMGTVIFWTTWIFGFWICGTLPLGVTTKATFPAAALDDVWPCGPVWFTLTTNEGKTSGSLVICWPCVSLAPIIVWGLGSTWSYLLCSKFLADRKAALVLDLHFSKFSSVAVWILLDLDDFRLWSDSYTNSFLYNLPLLRPRPLLFSKTISLSWLFNLEDEALTISFSKLS